ncbi:uncharacterized protein EAF02_011369 [Botrytis sinoallii]|uniref:uncharacterized protein n=1 Tax=Botrytis sinoallii TaxID=1463999 RepID=UPI0018FF3B22|nr:uncharacterized protein EAF02_011369 [Botrytis sinoallii]KAF7857136.1 hypothetical protein EAF02_011369 [Botrytis sinoallii]
MAPTRTDSSSFDDDRQNSGPSSEMPFRKPPNTDERFPIWHRPDVHENPGPDFQMAIEECPVTEERLPFWQDDTCEEGFPIGKHRSERLRQADGIVSPRDTYNGFRRLGWSPLLAIGSAMIINSIFSYPTLPPGQLIPDFKLRIHTERIHKGKHGSDSGTFDHEGRFIPQHFEDLFSKYAGRDKQDITKAEIFAYVKSQRNVLDVIGWAAALLEWSATWHLLSPKDGKMKKDDIRRIYDGSLFYEIAARREKESREKESQR